MKNLYAVVFCLTFVAWACAPKIQENLSADISPADLQTYIRYLSSDDLRGRKTGEEGNRLAAAYIGERFREDGLTPAGDNGGYLQNFDFISSSKPGERNSLRFVAGTFTLSPDPVQGYRPLSFSVDTTLTTPLVFAGYGISSHDSIKYDDYTGIDVKNKIVCVLRYSPPGLGNQQFEERASLMIKAMTAREKGAAGILYLTSPAGTDGASLASFRAPASGQSGVAAAVVRWEDIDSVFHAAGKDLHQIQRQIDSSKTPASFETGITVTLQTQIIKVHTPTANVVGYFPGSDSLLRNQYLVIGAHFDHLGMGGEGSLAPDTVAVHHGADDNASGTAGLMELAQYFGAHRNLLRRSVVFVTFTGEELGLLGSDYYVKHPSFPLDSTIAMINMDMIGRLKDSTLVVEGMGTAEGFDSLLKRLNSDSLTLKLKPDGYGPSDQASFYSKNIPVIFFFTNLHKDYHKPSDTWDKINYSGEATVVRLASRVAAELSAQPQRPKYLRTASPTMGGGDRPGARVSLGVIPDFAEDVPGMKISGTRPGSAAEKAGLKGGDVIIKFGGKEIKNIYDFTFMLGQCKAGDKVTLVVKRGDGEVTLDAVMEARK